VGKGHFQVLLGPEPPHKVVGFLPLLLPQHNPWGGRARARARRRRRRREIFALVEPL